MSNYEKSTKHIELGKVYIKESSKFMTFRLGTESLIVQLEPVASKLDRLLKSGHMTQEEYDKEINKDAESGAKYRALLRVDQ